MSCWETWGVDFCLDQLGTPPRTAAHRGMSPPQFPLLLPGLLWDGEGGQAQGWASPFAYSAVPTGGVPGAGAAVWEQEDCISHPEDCIARPWDCFCHPYGTAQQYSPVQPGLASRTKAEHGELQQH